MSVAREYVMDRPPEFRERAQRHAAPEPAGDDQSASFWPWFAIGLLLFCWIAEASMCAERGF
jgi:hypothetical protein